MLWPKDKLSLMQVGYCAVNRKTGAFIELLGLLTNPKQLYSVEKLDSLHYLFAVVEMIISIHWSAPEPPLGNLTWLYFSAPNASKKALEEENNLFRS